MSGLDRLCVVIMVFGAAVLWFLTEGVPYPAGGRLFVILMPPAALCLALEAIAWVGSGFRRH